MIYSTSLGIFAPEAGWTPPIRYLLRRARVLEIAKRLPRGHLLEVGCGAGALLCDFDRIGFQTTGLESSESALAVARTIAALDQERHTIEESAGDSWAEKFAVVCAFDVLEHIEHDGAALEEWKGWLAPGGTMVLSVPAHPQRWGAGDEWAGHWRRYDRDSLARLLESQQLDCVHFECYGFPVANLTEWIGEFSYRRMIEERGDLSKLAATHASGIDRRDYSRLATLISSLPGRLGLRTAMAMQSLARNTDWGSGYLIAARKR
ncbi:class I SAM-dependent methyltransferase [Xanthomonas sp. D-109]|uniref:class I SAM-dependent methyltransferase n=1 Tax=Xanthomonas sp. D-109 TaxID=2821274 RepID=UPI001AD9FBB0|nr:class I SAM-dependent methyltransferase [Xanthomonas sp. D-109]MBO9881572.1 class I SAM-dependent methyltransferase [Xanthomonas sp. D-109]